MADLPHGDLAPDVRPDARRDPELSDDANAILAYARRWGTPFTRVEITDIAPGAAWDAFARWPRTVAKLDPIRELVRAGTIEEHETVPLKGRSGKYKAFKRWRLTERESVPSLATLLDELIDLVPDPRNWEEPSPPGQRTVQAIRDEILRRFGGTS